MATRLTPQPAILRCPIPSRWGPFIASYSVRGLLQLDFPSPSTPSPHPPANLPPSIRHWHALTRQALQKALRGMAPTRLPPLDLHPASSFRRAVWQALRTIPLGSTLTYGELARRVGSPRAARAIGQACRANPIPVLIPCHRVLAAAGGLGGFSGGLDWKKRLLTAEGWPPPYTP